MRLPLILLTCLSLSPAIGDAVAGPILDRVKQHGVVRCSSFERPGLAQDVSEVAAAAADANNTTAPEIPWHGLNVDICRAVAAAVLGSADKISFHTYETPADLKALYDGEDDVAFLSGKEIVANSLGGRVVPGPSVFMQSLGVIVAQQSPYRHLVDLGNLEGICFISGAASEGELGAYFKAHGTYWRPVAYSEVGEMIDAYNVQQCHGMAAEVTTLSSYALQRGINNLESRYLPESIVAFPIMATTGTADGQWSAIVAWTVHTLVAANRPATEFTLGGADALQVPMPEVGLERGWQKRVVDAVGNYRAIFDRNVGANSPLHLPAGLNDGPENGGTMLGPIIE